jgi:hypothetical protein
VDDDQAQQLVDSWTERLDREGSVVFGKSRRTLVRLELFTLVLTAGGVAMVVGSHGRDRALGAMCLVMFAAAAVGFGAVMARGGPALRVDGSGVHVPRRIPLDAGWDQISEVYSYTLNEKGSTQLLVRLWPEVYDAYTARMPGWQRFLFRLGQRSERRDSVVVPFPDAPYDELASWLDREVGRRQAAPRDLVVMPYPDEPPLWGARTRRPVPPGELGVSTDLRATLEDFATRAAPVAEEVVDGGSPGAAWGYLAAEGRELCARLERELGTGFSVVWFEDGPRAAADS